ncbi:MAG: YkvA family protein [Prevotella sp.]
MDIDLPDFMSYKDKFSKKGFVEKISRIAKRAGVKLAYASLVLYYTLESDKVSIKDKAIIIGALGYLISPIDAVPDAIPIAGLGDDLAVLIYVLRKVWGEVSEDVMLKAKRKLSKWFDQDEIVNVDEIFTDNPEDTPI